MSETQEKRTSGTSNAQSFLKKRRVHELKAATEKVRERKAKSKKVVVKQDTFIRAEKFVANARASLRGDIKITRHSKARPVEVAPEGTSVVVVIRVKTRRAVSPKIQILLTTLGLPAPNILSFVSTSKTNLAMMNLVAPYITWGIPDHKTVADLVTKRGYTVLPGGRKQPLTSNIMIEQALGRHGIICLEDIVHELFTAGAQLDRVKRYLAPFRLNSPPGGWVNLENTFAKGGATGDRKEEINRLVRSMC